METDVHDGVVVCQLAAEDPVATVEACKVRADMADSPTAVEVCQIGPVSDGRCLMS